MPQAGETVLILGLNGKVGQAATQIAHMAGARVIGVVRKRRSHMRAMPMAPVDGDQLLPSTDVAARCAN